MQERSETRRARAIGSWNVVDDPINGARLRPQHARDGRAILGDALAARRLWGNLAGFAAVENLTDREYLVGRPGIDTVGAPRTFRVGLGYATR